MRLKRTAPSCLAWRSCADHARHAPGELQQNELIEYFNGGLRDELLKETLFTSLTHLRDALATCNTVRSHNHVSIAIAAFNAIFLIKSFALI